jgi:cytochrome P450
MNLMTSTRVPPNATTSGRDEIRHPARFFLWLAQHYGDIVQYRSTLEPAYLINQPDYIEHVLLANGTNYNKDTYLNKYILESVVGQGLLTSENPLWRKQRKLIQPAFHLRTLGRFEAQMHQAIERALGRLEPIAVAGGAVNIAQEMVRLTLDIVCQALFSYDSTDHAEEVGRSIDTMVSIGKPRHRKVQEGIATLDRIVYSIIDSRRKAPDASRDDLLTMLLNARYEDGGAMSDRQVRDEVMSLLVAGHETTANTLSWAWYLLALNPGSQRRLNEELDRVLNGRLPSEADFQALNYTGRVIREAMRLYPSAWSISRRALGDDEIGGYAIPAGAIVAMSPYTMHRHPAFWPQPEEFDPDRFRPELEATRPRFAYFPFGGGARTCIGNHFALMESMMIIPAIAQRYWLEVVPEHPVEEHALVTLRPRHGILVRLSCR